MTEKQSLQARLYHQLDARPDRRAIAFIAADNSFEWLSMSDFFQHGIAAAHRLAEAGLRKKDVCVIVLSSGPQAAALLLGTLLLGGIPLLVAPPTLQRYNSDLLRILLHTIRKTDARVVVHDDAMATVPKEQEALRRKVSLLPAGDWTPTIPPPPALERVIPRPNDVAAMQLTSGTTGFPRVCVWKQRAVLAALDGMARAMKLSDDDICFNWTPLYHDMGLVNNFFTCLSRGLPMVLQKPDDFVKKPARWLIGLDRTGATVTWSPNFGFALATERIRDDELAGVRLDRVRGFWNAAERIHWETMVAFRERFTPFGLGPQALQTNFGCAENIGGATFSDPDGDFIVEHVERGPFQEAKVARPVPPEQAGDQTMAVVGAGRPHDGMKIHILSHTGKRLPDGHIGQIGLLTPSRMEGYLKDAAATKRAIHGKYLRTGDLAYMRDGELFWVGRSRERITIRGKKLDPSDFERALFDVPGLRKGCFAAFGVEDRAQGTEKIVIVVEVRQPLVQPAEKIIAAIRRQILSQVDISVGEVVLVRSGTLAKTSSGKRRHNHFRRLYLDGGLTPFLAT